MQSGLSFAWFQFKRNLKHKIQKRFQQTLKAQEETRFKDYWITKNNVKDTSESIECN